MPIACPLPISNLESVKTGFFIQKWIDSGKFKPPQKEISFGIYGQIKDISFFLIRLYIRSMIAMCIDTKNPNKPMYDDYNNYPIPDYHFMKEYIKLNPDIESMSFDLVITNLQDITSYVKDARIDLVGLSNSIKEIEAILDAQNIQDVPNFVNFIHKIFEYIKNTYDAELLALKEKQQPRIKEFLILEQGFNNYQEDGGKLFEEFKYQVKYQLLRWSSSVFTIILTNHFYKRFSVSELIEILSELNNNLAIDHDVMREHSHNMLKAFLPNMIYTTFSREETNKEKNKTLVLNEKVSQEKLFSLLGNIFYKKQVTVVSNKVTNVLGGTFFYAISTLLVEPNCELAKSVKQSLINTFSDFENNHKKLKDFYGILFFMFSSVAITYKDNDELVYQKLVSMNNPYFKEFIDNVKPGIEERPRNEYKSYPYEQYSLIDDYVKPRIYAALFLQKILIFVNPKYVHDSLIKDTFYTLCSVTFPWLNITKEIASKIVDMYNSYNDSSSNAIKKSLLGLK